MKTHAPGPWEIGPDGRSIKNVYGSRSCDDSQLWPVRVTGRGVNQLANARLIAAAPELLDALKDMVDIVSRNVDGRPGRDDAAECWDRARDAIAKAEGRTQ